MKKALEAELISLAHKILQLKGKKDVSELKHIAAEVYEKLSILDFAEKHFDGPKPTIGKKRVTEILSENDEAAAKEKVEPKAAEVSTEKAEPKQDIEPEIEPEPEVETELEVEREGPKNQSREKTENSASSFEPEGNEQEPVSSQTEEPKKESKPKSENVEDSGVHYDDLPQFEPVKKSEPEQKPNPTEKRKEIEKPRENDAGSKEKAEDSDDLFEAKETPETKASKPEKKPVEPSPDLFSSEEQPKTRNNPDQHQFSLNDRLKKGIQIGLNDRLVFIKHLFNGSAPDYNRVLSQLNTMNSYDEAEDFLLTQVKPDYDWEDEEKYEKNFLRTLENRFD